MIQNQPLTAEQRKKSQFNYLCFNAINGASYMCLGETVIVLFAVRLNMSNTIISLIGAMLYLGYLLLPLGVNRTAAVGAAQCMADFWVCRNVSVLMVAFCALINLWSNIAAGIVLLLGSFLFYGFRAAGCVMSQPLVGDISDEKERPVIIGKSFGLFYVSGVVAMIGISILLHFNDSMIALSSIIVAGAMLGVTASTFVRNITETSILSESAHKPILDGISYVLKTKIVVQLVTVWFFCNIGNILVGPMGLLTLKRGGGVSDTNAILFSLFQLIIQITACQWGIPLTRKIGPRKVIIIGYLLFFPVCIFWLLLPSMEGFTFLNWLLILIPFAIQGVANMFTNNALIHYFLMSVPKEKQVASSMLLNLIHGAAAGLIGIMIVTGLMKCSELMAKDGTPMTVFHWYFSLTLPILLIGVPFIFKLKKVIDSYREEHGEDSVRKTIQR